MIQYWPDEQHQSILIDDKYRIEFVHKIERLDILTIRLKLTKIQESQTRELEHYQIKSWNETDCSLDPISLLRLQYVVTRSDRECSPIVLHT